MDFKRRKKKRGSQDETVEPSKEETAIAKHLRWNCPTKSSSMMGNKVEYFIASKAVDCLLDSNWASGKKNTEILFTDRESVVDYLDRLLALGFFSRVLKIKKKKDKDKTKEKDKEKEKEKEKEKTEEGDAKKSKKREKKDKPEEGKKADDEEGQGELAKNVSETASEEGKKKRKVKVKLELHDEQYFLDGDEAYVWIYDPVHPKTFVMGILVVFATIAICLFPLWPSNVRECVWYLSVIAAIGVGMILVLAVLRYIIFGIIWALTAGRHKFWLLPNLTEECGFLESFRPLYTYEYCPGTSKEQTPEDDKQDDQDEDDGLMKDDNETSPTIDDEKGSSEEKENGDRDSWVKLTEEEVENAKTEMEEDDQVNENENMGQERTVDPVC